MDCGHQWSTEHHSKYARCPKCNAYLKIKDTRLRTMTDKSYFSIVSTQDGLQLQRIFLMEVKTVKGSPAQKSVMEIARYWTNEQGKTAVTALKRTMGFTETLLSVTAIWNFDTIMRCMLTYLTLMYIHTMRYCQYLRETACEVQ